MKIEKYTTGYGTVIPARVIAEIRNRILDGEDWQLTQQECLRDIIPVHEDDHIEANEVYDYVDGEIDYEQLVAEDLQDTNPMSGYWGKGEY